MAYFWRVIFNNYGVANKVINSMGGESIVFFNSDIALFIVTLIFILKSIGFNMVLFITGLSYISDDYYELARVEGSSHWNSLRRITLVYITPTIFITLLMSIINSFKIFREIYMLFGDYPHTSVYMLQHYMNNLFSKAMLGNLSVAASIITFIITVVVAAIHLSQRRLMENL